MFARITTHKPLFLLLAIVLSTLISFACTSTEPPKPLPSYTPTSPLAKTPTFTQSPTSTPEPTNTILPKSTSTHTPVPTATEGSRVVFVENTCIPQDTLQTLAKVIEIVDGDTIVVSIDGEEYTVRYIGIDTPEQGIDWAAEAIELNRELVEGKTVLLIKDVSDTDIFDRLLRYVVLEDGVFINEELVKQGLATVGSWPPDIACEKYLREIESATRIAGIGLWVRPTKPPTQPAQQEVLTTGNVEIVDIFYNGVVSEKEPDEYVEIRNNDTNPIQMVSWTLRDEADHVFVFPEFIIQPAQVCRVYTNEYHEEWCGFNYGWTGSAIWNNSGDCATLRDSSDTPSGVPVDTYCY